MRNLFYIEVIPVGLRAKIGASPNSPVMIYFHTLRREISSNYITLCDINGIPLASISLDRFSAIDREVLSKLDPPCELTTTDLLIHYRFSGRTLRTP